MAYQRIAQVFRDGTLTGLSDRLLLERYIGRRDEVAFETIVARHGPMVRNVCRQLLRDPHDVDDAFQATFLALIRKVGSIRVEESLGPWLYTVAGRIATRARANRLSRVTHEPGREPFTEPSAEDRPDSNDTSRIVHEELARLPERLRAPIVLCYLEGSTHEMAASQLGCPVGTVRSRLARARAVLQKRMVRRGLTLPAGAVAALLESRSRADFVPLHLRKALIEFATGSISEVANGTLAGGAGVSASAVALLEGVLYVMRIKTLTIAAASVAAAGIALAVIGTTGLSVAGTPHERTSAASEAKGEDRPAPAAPNEESESILKTYAVGDLMTKGRTVGEQPPKEAYGKAAITMMPLIQLITSTIEPGSWSIFDEHGVDVTEKYRRGLRKPQTTSEAVGSITPFFLSMSLIIRTKADVHEKVADLLLQLRRLTWTRENPGADIYEQEERLDALRKRRTADRRDSRLSPADVKKSISEKSSGSRARIDQLLDELRKEIAKLPAEPDR